MKRSNIKFGKSKRKYGNKKVSIDGHKFDSKKEATRYQHLKLELRAGTIQTLEIQPHFKFEIDGKPLRENRPRAKRVTYTADFRYTRNGVEIVEDVKSPATAARSDFKIKKALYETLYQKKLTIYY